MLSSSLITAVSSRSGAGLVLAGGSLTSSLSVMGLEPVTLTLTEGPAKPSLNPPTGQMNQSVSGEQRDESLLDRPHWDKAEGYQVTLAPRSCLV